MPTLITHALVGASITTLRQHSISPAKFLVVAALLAILPDIDVLGFRYGIPYSDMLGHRGLTHSLSFAGAIGVLSALVIFPEVQRFSRPFWWLSSLLFIATASHGILDAFTNAGLGIGFLIPFDDTRYFAPWRPLTASPLSISRFLSGSSTPILMNEFRWIGIPLIVVVTVMLLLRRYIVKDGA